RRLPLRAGLYDGERRRQRIHRGNDRRLPQWPLRNRPGVARRYGAGERPGPIALESLFRAADDRPVNRALVNTMHPAQHRWRKIKNALVQVATCSCALVVIVPLALIFYHVLKSGIGAVNWDFFTKLPKPVGEAGGGMANAIVGTLELLGLAALFGVPAGVLGGIFLSETGSPR